MVSEQSQVESPDEKTKDFEPIRGDHSGKEQANFHLIKFNPNKRQYEIFKENEPWVKRQGTGWDLEFRYQGCSRDDFRGPVDYFVAVLGEP